MDREQTPTLVAYYLRVTLQDSVPPIWRDIIVPSNLTLENLHYVIQTAMGWNNDHHHHFIADNILYTDIADNDNPYHEGSDAERSERNHTVSQLLTEEKSIILYEYDLSDGWLHKIELRKILPAHDNHAFKPHCVKGKGACPPEDCGGIWGYTDMLEALQGADSEERNEILTWLGEGFNPEHFDLEAVNRILKNFTC
jgi:hypothetical protein